ncbi:MAG: manganese efflux pump [Eggerthellaceae bacterium]|nr:manganese efflux pump [Eggerthellaceae bacterium]
MGILELFVIGLGLSMDAFAVAVCKGLCMRRVNWGHALVIALFFGGFQALMPLIGWALGTGFAAVIEPVDHWVAFGLLAFIGGKMLWDAFHEDDEAPSCPAEGEPLDLRELTLMAVATSIDALAVGVTFAFLGVSIWLAVAVIGVTTFALSFLGVAVGNQFGTRFERPATIAGGVVLILIGLKILLEHLGLISF